MLYRVSPFVNFFYISAWYPTIFILDAAVAARSGRYYMLSRPRFAISLLVWSAVLWFFFELVNFRVTNWYYVFLPPDRWLRWLGTTVSFATVLPAIFLAERWLAVGNAFEGIRWPTFNVSRRTLQVVFLTGVVFALLSLAWPRYFFPMIWGALTLLLESLNYRSDPKRSLLADLAAGRRAGCFATWPVVWRLASSGRCTTSSRGPSGSTRYRASRTSSCSRCRWQAS